MTDTTAARRLPEGSRCGYHGEPTETGRCASCDAERAARLVTWQVIGTTHDGDERCTYLEAPAPITNHAGPFTSADVVPECLRRWAETVYPPSIYRSRRYAGARLARLRPDDGPRGYAVLAEVGVTFHDDADAVRIGATQ
jgi:hypothetical protein